MRTLRCGCAPNFVCASKCLPGSAAVHLPIHAHEIGVQTRQRDLCWRLHAQRTSPMVMWQTLSMRSMCHRHLWSSGRPCIAESPRQLSLQSSLLTGGCVVRYVCAPAGASLACIGCPHSAAGWCAVSRGIGTLPGPTTNQVRCTADRVTRFLAVQYAGGSAGTYIDSW